MGMLEKRLTNPSAYSVKKAHPEVWDVYGIERAGRRPVDH